MQGTPTSTDSHTLPTNAGNTHLHWLSHLTYQCREHPPLPSTPWPTTTDSHTLPTNAGNTHIHPPHPGPPPLTLTPYLPMQGTPTSTLHTLAHHHWLSHLTYQCREHPPPPSTPWPTTTDSHTLPTNVGNTHLHPPHPGPPPLTLTPYLPMQGTPTSTLHTLAHHHWLSHLTYQCREHPPPPSTKQTAKQPLAEEKYYLEFTEEERLTFLFFFEILLDIYRKTYTSKRSGKWRYTIASHLESLKTHTHVKHCIYYPTFINKNNNKVTQNNC